MVDSPSCLDRQWCQPLFHLTRPGIGRWLQGCQSAWPACWSSPGLWLGIRDRPRLRNETGKYFWKCSHARSCPFGSRSRRFFWAKFCIWLPRDFVAWPACQCRTHRLSCSAWALLRTQSRYSQYRDTLLMRAAWLQCMSRMRHLVWPDSEVLWLEKCFNLFKKIINLCKKWLPLIAVVRINIHGINRLFIFLKNCFGFWENI